MKKSYVQFLNETGLPDNTTNWTTFYHLYTTLFEANPHVPVYRG